MTSPEGTVGFRMRVRVAERDLHRFPKDDDLLGENLFELLKDALSGGRVPRPAMLVLRDRQVDQFDLLPILQSGGWTAQRLLGGLVGRENVDCAALVGALVVRPGRRQEAAHQAAVCFVEWPDNRWWTAWQPLDGKNRLVGPEPLVRRAIDGWPKPNGVGGWFATARRDRVRLELKPVDDAPIH
jgi:hypothetical protein